MSIAARMISLCCLGLALAPVPSRAQDYYQALYQVMEQRYPVVGAEAPLLEWSQRTVEQAVLQLVPLHAILEQHENAQACGGVDGEALPCLAEMEAFSNAGRWRFVKDVCPSAMPRPARMDCLLAVQQDLGDRAFRSGSMAGMHRLRLQGMSGPFNFAWLGRHDPQWVRGQTVQDYDAMARETAEIDAVILFVDYVLIRAAEEAGRLHRAACSALGSEGLAAMGCMLDMSANHASAAAADAAEQLRLADCTTRLCEWLAEARGTPQPVALPTVEVRQVPAAQPDAPSPPPPASDAGAAAEPADEPPREEGRARQVPRIWVEGGKPIFLPHAEPDAPAEPAPPAAPAPGDLVVTKGERPGELPTGLAEVVRQDEERRRAHFLRLASELDMAEGVWEVLEQGARVRDAWNKWRGRPGQQALMMRRASHALLFAKVAVSTMADDPARAYAGGIELIASVLGGKAGVFVIRASGFERALVSAQDAGYNIPHLMAWGSRSVSALLSPFAGPIEPYSQMAVTDSPVEPALPAEMRAYQDVMRQATEDARYKTKCKVLLIGRSECD